MAKIKKLDKELRLEMEQQYQKYLKNNGVIEKIPYNNGKENTLAIGNINYKVPELHSLSEAANLYGEKNKVKKKVKKIDLTGINKDLIPASLQGLFDKDSQVNPQDKSLISVSCKDKESHEANTN